MNAQAESTVKEMYDAMLTELNPAENEATFNVGDSKYRFKCPHSLLLTPGTIGRLRFPANGIPFGFYPYPDQRMRRVPAEDDAGRKLWGWNIGALHFSAKAGIVPGKGGLVVSEDTEALVIEIPREFIDYCGTYRLLPRTVLRGFIADLCELMDWYVCPREDGYSSNGSDERLLAQRYFHRAYGWLPTVRDKSASRSKDNGSQT